jgi:hypothetical protein
MSPTSPLKPRRHHRGHSLIETLFSLSLLMGAALTVVDNQAALRRQSHTAKQLSQWRQAAQREMDLWRLSGYNHAVCPPSPRPVDNAPGLHISCHREPASLSPDLMALRVVLHPPAQAHTSAQIPGLAYTVHALVSAAD